MKECATGYREISDNWLLRTFPHAKDEKTFGLCHPKTSVRESAALFVVS